MKPRRLATVAVIGVLFVGALAACRADPSVAAYVDNAQITEAQVDQVVGPLQELIVANTEEQLAQTREQLDSQVVDGAEPAGQGEAADAGMSQAEADVRYAEVERQLRQQQDQEIRRLRTRVVEIRVFTEAAHRYAAAEDLEVPTVTPEQIAQITGLAADHPYVVAEAEYAGAMEMVRDAAEPAQPTDADQREVYDNMVAQGYPQPFEATLPELSAEAIGHPVAVRDLYAEILDRVEVTVNPRYALNYQIPVPVLGGESWLTVSVGDPAVVEAG